MSCSRNKKNGKKNKNSNPTELLQVKSLKLDTLKQENVCKNSVKSEGSLCKPKSIIAKNKCEPEENGNSELEACLMKKFKGLSVNSEGESNTASTSHTKNGANELPEEDDVALVMQYGPEEEHEELEKLEDYASYKYFAKNSKSIKFTNQVTVLYFNGEDILYESMEPLKKEQEQQQRNKEMRKEHLLSKGQLDNLYLF